MFGKQTRYSISISGVYKSFRRGKLITPVLSDISLRVQPGQCVFLVGPSGSGKTTLLSILGCLLQPDQGQVEILGQNVTRMSRRGQAMMRRERIGFLFQKFNLIRGLNALENVAMSLMICGESFADAKGKATVLLDRVGLGDQLLSDPRRMSVGQCQRIAFARALISKPDILMADEPTASLDSASGIDVLAMIRELTRKENKTAIVVTHDHRIFRFADHIVVLEDGRISDIDEAVADSDLPDVANSISYLEPSNVTA